MTRKAKKKLIERAIEKQNAAPSLSAPKKSVVKMKEEPILEKLRGYKIVQVSPKPILYSAPSRLF